MRTSHDNVEPSSLNINIPSEMKPFKSSEQIPGRVPLLLIIRMYASRDFCIWISCLKFFILLFSYPGLIEWKQCDWCWVKLLGQISFQKRKIRRKKDALIPLYTNSVDFLWGIIVKHILRWNHLIVLPILITTHTYWVLNIVHLASHFLWTTPCHYYFHFVSEETDARRGYVISPRSHT